MRRKADKENLYRNHQRKIDLLRTKSSFMNKYLLTNSASFKSKNRNYKNKAKKASEFSMKKLIKWKISSPTKPSPKKKDKPFLSIFLINVVCLTPKTPSTPKWLNFLRTPKVNSSEKNYKKSRKKPKLTRPKRPLASIKKTEPSFF